MRGPTRVFIVAVVAIAATDGMVFYHVHRHPGEITIPFVLLVIGITILPIAIRYVLESRRSE